MWPRARHPRAAEAQEATPPSDLIRWRRRQLLRAGFEADLAASIAADCAIDLHALIELVERECPPGLAARIVTPLDDERKRC